VLLTPEEIARATGGAWNPAPPDHAIKAVSTDTRTMPPGALFVALRGENYDAHGFLDEAVRRGAAAVAVHQPEAVQGLAVPALVVGDTLRALGDIASAWRGHCPARRLAVVGSSGKTTTKNMLGSIMQAAGPCLVTEGNLNNLVGVPLTLLRMQQDHVAAVIEMGMNVPGELERLTQIVNPDVLLFLGVGTAHIGQFGSLDGLLQAKAEAVRTARADTLVIYDAQSPNTGSIIKEHLGSRPSLSFAVEAPADVWAEGVQTCGAGYCFKLHLGGELHPVRLPGFGRYNVTNATAAAAAAWLAGVGADVIVRVLAGYTGGAMRSQTRLLDGREWILDCYNANPDSMRAAIASAREWAGPDARLGLILGEMRELGGESARAHEEIGRVAAGVSPAFVLTMGNEMRAVTERMAASGVCAEWFDSHEALTRRLRRITRDGDVILLKGSRANQLEKIWENWESLAQEVPRKQ